MSLGKIYPWNVLGIPQRLIDGPKGMIGPEERRLLYWVARFDYTGAGALVDAGSFLGASAFCLASGLSARGDSISSDARIHCFDFFEARDDYVERFINKEFGPIDKGADYFDIFESQMGSLSGWVVAHRGDILLKTWDRGPIEVLFLDICKTQEINSWIVRELFGMLIPGRSILIQQDFYHAWHPFIHITMELLEEYVEILSEFVPFQTRVYRLIKSIPDSILSEIAHYEYPPAERLRLLDKMISKSSPPVHQMGLVLKLYQLYLDNDTAGFLEKWAQLIRRYDLSVNELWATEAKKIKNLHLQRSLQLI